METKLKIDGMSCGHCVAGVKRALEGVRGVQTAEVVLEPGEALIRHADDVSISDMIAAVEEEGYRAEII